MSANSSTYNHILSKGIESDLPVDVGENKLRFTTDTGRLFLDNEGLDRIEITDFVKGLTKDQILSTISPLPKVYISSDTHEIFTYDTTENEWVQYGGGGSSLQVVELTQRQYDNLTPEEKADPTKIYAVPGDGNYLKFLEISASDYEALTEEEKLDPYTVYLTPGIGTYFRVIDIDQEDYDNLSQEEKINPNNLYLISDNDNIPKIKIVNCTEINSVLTSDESLFDLVEFIEQGYDISFRYIHEEYNGPDSSLSHRCIRMLKMQEYIHEFDTTGESHDDIKLTFIVETTNGTEKYIMQSTDGNDTYIITIDNN